MTSPLTATLEAALLRQLGETWAEINQNHFRGKMRRPVFALSEGARLGAWVAARRTLELSRALVLEQPWAVVREVCKHEMAHQFVDEVLEIHDQTAHGPGVIAWALRRRLPFDDNTFEVVYHSHILEHFNADTHWVEPALQRFLEAGFMVFLDDRYLSLALPANPHH